MYIFYFQAFLLSCLSQDELFRYGLLLCIDTTLLTTSLIKYLLLLLHFRQCYEPLKLLNSEIVILNTIIQHLKNGEFIISKQLPLSKIWYGLIYFRFYSTYENLRGFTKNWIMMNLYTRQKFSFGNYNYILKKLFNIFVPCMNTMKD